MWFRLSNETLIEADQILLQIFTYANGSTILVDFRLQGKQQKTVTGFANKEPAEEFMDAVHKSMETQPDKVVDLRGIISAEAPFADGSAALTSAL